MNEYCEKHRHNELCRQTNRVVSHGFCKVVCKQRPEQYKTTSLDAYRAHVRKPLTEAQKADTDTVSVMIPVGAVDEQWLEQTVKSVKQNAVGPLEILVEHDNAQEGHRVLTNRMAAAARGKYLLRLDCHSSMSEGWDARMKESCGPTTLLKPMLDALDTETWTGKGRDMGMILLTKTMQNTYPLISQSLEDREIEMETMSILGCAYMIQKDYYWQHDGCEEALGIWGAGGLEWVLKVWLTGGRVMLRTDVVSCHYFRDGGKTPFQLDIARLNKTFVELGTRWRSGLGKGQTRPLSWLGERFSEYLNDTVQWAGKDNRYVYPLKAREALQAAQLV